MNILIVFKTHLDLGYTDLAAKVEEKYMNERSFLTEPTAKH